MLSKEGVLTKRKREKEDTYGVSSQIVAKPAPYDIGREDPAREGICWTIFRRA